MKSKLDQLERYLRNMIESSTNVLWHDQPVDLVQELIEAMEKQAAADPEGVFQMPGALVIHLHPQNYALWLDNEDWIVQISTALQEAAVELDLPITGRPLVSLEADAEIPENQVQVHIVHQQESRTKTAILSSSNPPGSGQSTQNDHKAFLILENGDHFPLNQSVINIGRRQGNELMLDDLHISREHAQIRYAREHHVLFDLNSKGGTFVNGRKISQHILQPGDVISLSGHPVIYVQEKAAAEDEERSSEQTGSTRIISPPDENGSEE